MFTQGPIMSQKLNIIFQNDDAAIVNKSVSDLVEREYSQFLLVLTQ